VGAIYGAGWGESRIGRCKAGLAACSAAVDPLHIRIVEIRAVFPMRALLDVIVILLQIYIYLLIAAAVLSWLVAFNVVNSRNQFVAMVGDFLYRVTEPVLRPIRNIMPNLGGIDISPVILILIIILIEKLIYYYIYPNVF
jgi:YggT family protein